MNDREKMGIKLASIGILKARTEIAKDNHNTDEIATLLKEHDTWMDLMLEIGKTKPKYAYVLNEYIYNNRPLKDIAVDLNITHASICNISSQAREYLLETGLWLKLK